MPTITRKPLLVFFLASSLILSAQTEVDSLKTALQNQVSESEQITTYRALYETLKYDAPEEAIGYLNKAITLAEKTNNTDGILQGLLAYGDYLETTSEKDSALATYERVYKLASSANKRPELVESLIGQGSVLSSLQRLEEADSVAFIGIDIAQKTPIDSLRLIQFYTILSNTAYFRSDYEKSIEFDQKALAYNQNNLSKRAKSLLNIGTTHDVLKNWDKANDYYLEALETAKKAGDKRLTALAHLELGTLNTNLEEYEVARTYYSQALGHFRLVEDRAMEAHVLHNLAKIHVRLQEFNPAIAKFKEALSIIETVNSPTSKGHFLYQLGIAYYEKKDYKNAEVYLLKAKDQFFALENKNMQTWVLSRLSDLYEASKDYEKAFNYLQQVKVRDDSILSADSAREIAEIEEKYQNEKKQQEIDLLSAENEINALRLQKQANLRNYLILVALLLLLLIVVIYNRYQLKNKANAKLRELDAVKTKFFTNISHEFRTPLTLITSPVQDLLSKKNDAATTQALQVVDRNAKVLTKLTNQILELSKLEAGELSLQVAPGDFVGFLKVIAASFESLAVAQKIDFQTHLESAPKQVYFDEDKVQKILNNLLSNAFKFTSNEGQVVLKATEENGRVHVAVTDTGAGIKEEDQALIFRRFYQNTTNSVTTAGTGVGLTLSKELALLHHGDVSVESALGEGTTFTLAFPIQKSAYQSQEIIAPSDSVITTPVFKEGMSLDKESKSFSTSDKIVLLVEDNPDLSNHISALLKHDFKVKQVLNGREGIEEALTIVPDIIVTDLMMPEVDGVALSNTLKANEKTSHIPIIMLTAKADRDTKLDGLKTGVDDFLTKPFDNEELLVRIKNRIEQQEKLRQKYEKALRLAPSKIKVSSPEETFLKKAMEVMEENLSNSDFSVELFQQAMGMSRMQLHRKLKALTNFSASEFIRDIRLQRAADLLASNSLNVSEVAYSSGFNSVSYFTQCFKQKFGKSPSAYKAT